MLGHNQRNWWCKKRFIIPFILVMVIVGVSLVLESVLLKQANKMAATMNPEFKGHIVDLDISLLKGAVVLQQVTGSLKKNDREFLAVKEVAVDLAWRELFKGNILFDVVVDTFNLKYSKDVLEASARLPKTEKKEAKQVFKLAHLDIRDSRISMLDLPGLKEDKFLTVYNIHGSVKELSQEKGTPLANYDIKASLTGKDKISLSGNLDMASEPVRWDLNAKLLKFDLASLNATLRKKLTLNYKKGTLDFYSEAKSENGKIYGYLKPFMNDVQYIGNKNEFKGGKHFLVEVVGTVSNWIFENKKAKSVATRVPFIYEDGVFSVESGEGLVQAVEHGLLETDKVDRGIENKYRLNAKNPAEVQAQEESLQEAKDQKGEDAKAEKKEAKEKAKEKKEEQKEKEKEDKE